MAGSLQKAALAFIKTYVVAETAAWLPYEYLGKVRGSLIPGIPARDEIVFLWRGCVGMICGLPAFCVASRPARAAREVQHSFCSLRGAEGWPVEHQLVLLQMLLAKQPP